MRNNVFKKNVRILITTDPFGKKDKRKELLKHFKKIKYNDVGRKYTQQEIQERLRKYDPEIIIAGTEKYDAQTLDCCPNLKMISRVGIGIDAIDHKECENRGIYVINTPDGPSSSVAELTVAQMINLLRKLPDMNNDLRKGIWNRYVGREISECTIGIIGHGRIGKFVAKKLKGFSANLHINDINPKQLKYIDKKEKSSINNILKSCDIISLHIPFESKNKNLISKKQLKLMKKNSILINTSRGEIVNNKDLYFWLKKNPKASAAIDVFETEPYKGKLKELSNCYLSPHAGSCTEKSRYLMEVGAIENVIKFIKKSNLK